MFNGQPIFHGFYYSSGYYKWTQKPMVENKNMSKHVNKEIVKLLRMVWRGEKFLFSTTFCGINMMLPPSDHATIINCFIEKKWRGREICRPFKSKKWSRTTVDSVIRRYEERNNLVRKKGSGRPATVTRGDKTTELLVLTESQESQPGTRKSLRSASKLVGMPPALPAVSQRNPSGNL